MRMFFPLIFVLLAIAGCSSGTPSTDASNPVVQNGAGKALTLQHHAADAGLTEKDFPIPFYPNSKPDEGAFDLTSTHDMPGGGRVIGSSRVTTDSVQQVVDFYKDKFKIQSNNVTDTYANLIGQAGPGDKDGVGVTIKKEDRGTTIAISADMAK